MTMSQQEELWQKEKCLSDCNQYMLEEQISCDVRFTFPVNNESGEERSIGAHKYMLISRSPVFSTMMSEEWASANKPIVIEDIEYEDFYTMLRYIYTDKANLVIGNAFGVLYAGQKYMLDLLVNHCTTTIIKALNHKNVWFIWEKAKFYGKTEICDACHTIIRNNLQATLTNPDIFKDISREMLLDILSYDVGTHQLSAMNFGTHQPSVTTLGGFISAGHSSCDELLFFNVAITWARERCKSQGIKSSGTNLRKMLGSAIFLIRFPLIPINQFADCVVTTGVLKQEEENAVFRYLTIKAKPIKFVFLSKPRNTISRNQAKAAENLFS